MPILDVPRNRHLESIGQEIRVRHDFLPHFCLLPFLYIWFTFPGHKKCVYVQKYEICQTICSKNGVTKAMSTP